MFDEVHERNLPTDLGLALTLDVAANLRPDLRVLAMSATPDTQRLAAVLGGAPVIASTGRQFDVDIRWVPRGRDARLEPAMVSAVQRALVEESGDVLAFLPGVGEINRTLSSLRDVVGSDVDLYPLAGALTLAEQDAALAASPTGRRRVVLTTDIAETSLTVDGVRVVVDSGLARAPRFDVRTGMTRLTTVVDESGVGRPTGRARRTHRPGRLLPAVEQARTRHPASRTGRPRSPRSTSPGSPSSSPRGTPNPSSWRSSTARRRRRSPRPGPCSASSARSTTAACSPTSAAR